MAKIISSNNTVMALFIKVARIISYTGIIDKNVDFAEFLFKTLHKFSRAIIVRQLQLNEM